MDVPPPWTSEGVGTAIPGSELGGQAGTATATASASASASATGKGTMTTTTTGNKDDTAGKAKETAKETTTTTSVGSLHRVCVLEAAVLVMAVAILV